ncbi:Spo0B domain-containing protein [Shimazuella sp. AN120528]|uniref:Spo0B domain-containing protein n=1 Tax=Shimazuella soli TaxID=1892854 RepID=UPI001F0FB2F7|nr:Spo0B domain-containing protein [Shimazuella soli]MCH5584106.1 Spo0B domain-containing protein [Shimazuella soli]
MPRSAFYLLVPMIVLVVWGLTTMDVVWFFTMTVVFVLSLFFYIRATKKEQQQQEAEKTKRLLSKIRHDLMNHVQVLMGYQMMNRVDKISEYLDRLAKQAMVEREISELKDEELAVFLLTLAHHFPQWEWEVQKLPTYVEQPTKTNEPIVNWLSTCIEWLAKMGENKYDWQKVVLQLSGDTRTNFFSFQVYDAENNLLPLHVPAGEWTNLKNQFKQLQLEMENQQRLILRTSVSR